MEKLDAKIQQLDSQEDDESRGIAGKIINNLSPGYNLGTANGINSGGLLGQLMNSMGIGANSGTYQHNDVALGRNYDNNKVYSPKILFRILIYMKVSLHSNMNLL